ncbi:AraC family transcriptional regulator [Kineococcus sp. SYSU DK001]|uniref:AraC family transcriptional regulator n=1 Tax=Kineococcus sp. SYSU DK001 TaxID=3383122 RepID=UPI003D7D374B
MTGDPLADAIGLLRPSSRVEMGLRARGSWAVRFDPVPHVKLGVVPAGQCWLRLEGREPVLLREGDFYLLANPPTYSLASDLHTAPTPAASLWQDAHDGVIHQGPAEGAETHVCGVRFAFDRDTAFVVDALPRLVHVRAGEPRGELLAHLAELLISERANLGVGSSLVMDHLAQLLFVHMLRAHAEQAEHPTGWLAALGDDGVGAALRAMHGDIARRWTVQELAAVSAMSRSAFAAAFKRRVGLPPLSYLIEWRMSLARDALTRSSRSISELAVVTGYESESAFSTAFRRVVGLSPRHFRDQVRAPRTSHA